MATSLIMAASFYAVPLVIDEFCNPTDQSERDYPLISKVRRAFRDAKQYLTRWINDNDIIDTQKKFISKGIPLGILTATAILGKDISLLPQTDKISAIFSAIMIGVAVLYLLVDYFYQNNAEGNR